MKDSFHCPELWQVAGPDLYRGNPYRVLGLNVNATTREIDQRSRRLKVGVEVKPDNPVAALFPPPDAAEAENAARAMSDPLKRFYHALFWFWPPAGGGGVGGADEVTAMHNLAVLHHARALELERMARGGTDPHVVGSLEAQWKKALLCWSQLLARENFWAELAARAAAMEDPRLTADVVEALKGELPAALISINVRLAVEASQNDNGPAAVMHMGLIRGSEFTPSDQDRAIDVAVGPVRDSLRQMVSRAGSGASGNPAQLAEACRELMSQTAKPLHTLVLLLPDRHPAVVAHHDEVAARVLEMQIEFANHTEDWQTSLDLLNRAESIARGEHTRRRLRENIEIVKRNIEAAEQSRKYATCWFCGKSPAEERSTMMVPLHRVIWRVPTGSGYQVRYETAKVPVPRCAACEKAAAKVERMDELPIWVSLVLAAVLVFVYFLPQLRADTSLGNIIGTVIVGGLGFGFAGGVLILATMAISWPFRYLFRQRSGVERWRQFPNCKELLDQGWQYGHKPSS